MLRTRADHFQRRGEGTLPPVHKRSPECQPWARPRCPSTPGPVAWAQPGLSPPLRQPGSEQAGRERADLEKIFVSRGKRLCASLAGPRGGLRRELLLRQGAAGSRPRGAAGGPPRLGPGSRRRPAPRPGGAGGSSRSRETCGPRAPRFGWAGATPSALRGTLSPRCAGDPAFPRGPGGPPSPGRREDCPLWRTGEEHPWGAA